MNDISILTLTSYVVSIVYIIVGVPLALNWIKPNAWYGIRIHRAYQSLDAWYLINGVGGKAFILAGLISLFVTALFQTFWLAQSIVMATVMVGITSVLGIIAVLYAVVATR